MSKKTQSNPEQTASKVIAQIHAIAAADGNYIFRGENRDYGKIRSNLYRDYEKKIETEHFDIEVVQNEILKKVKLYTPLKDETDILTELQHYGGKTNWLDFSADFLIALFFACNGEAESDGRIILFDRSQQLKGVKVIPPPVNQNNRVIFQKSIFIRCAKGYLDAGYIKIVKINSEWKNDILAYLNKYHHISTETIYGDLFGYIQNQTIHQDAYTSFYTGLTCYNQGKYDQAIEHYNSALKYNPNFAEAYSNRGLAYDDKSDYDRAMADYDRALQLNPNNAEVCNNRGVVYKNKGDYDRAIMDYDRALQLNPNLVEAYTNRGNAYTRKGDYDRAIADFDKALQLNSNYAEAYTNRGNAYTRKGDYDRAIADFDKALQLNPNSTEAYTNRGNAYTYKGDYDRAIADYETALQLNPNSTEAYTNRGSAYAYKGNYDHAIADFDRALEIDQNYALAYKNRGLAKSRSKNITGATADFQQALALATQQKNTNLIKKTQQLLDSLSQDTPAN